MQWTGHYEMGDGTEVESWCFHGLQRGTTHYLPEPQFFHLLNGNNHAMDGVQWELIR